MARSSQELQGMVDAANGSATELMVTLQVAKTKADETRAAYQQISEKLDGAANSMNVAGEEIYSALQSAMRAFESANQYRNVL